MSNHHVAKSQAEMAELFSQDLTTGVGRSVKHDSADKHVSGEAVYIDDRLEFPNQLHVYARTADRAHARILRIDTTPCYAFEGVRIAITHEDIPGLKDIGPVVAGDLNAEPDSTVVRYLCGLASLDGHSTYFQDAWRLAGDGGPGFTWSNANPHAAEDGESDKRIDYVLSGFHGPALGGRPVECRVVGDTPVDGVWPSDHFGVLAVLHT